MYGKSAFLLFLFLVIEAVFCFFAYFWLFREFEDNQILSFSLLFLAGLIDSVFVFSGNSENKSNFLFVIVVGFLVFFLVGFFVVWQVTSVIFDGVSSNTPVIVSTSFGVLRFVLALLLRSSSGFDVDNSQDF